VNGGRLSETLALLLRENSGRAAILSADAERAIRRRMAARWAGSIAAIVAVGAIGTVTVVDAFAGLRGDSAATQSPIPTPTIGVAAATFPVKGGPEFVSTTAGLKCGDPVPEPHPKEHDVGIALTPTKPDYAGEVIQNPGDTPSVIARLSQTVDTKIGIVADSGISLIIGRDGLVAGVLQYGPPEMGWNALGAGAAYEGQYGTQLVASWIFCPGDDTLTDSKFEAGTYDVVAITRVFSTRESVALYQALGLARGGWNLDPANLDPQGIYIPGSYDCAQTISGQSPARACLPDFTPNAKFDAAAATVTMLYDTKDFVGEFSAVLVSDPVSVFIPGKDSLPWIQGFDAGPLGAFSSIDAFTCGATAGYVSLSNQSSESVALSLDGTSSATMRTGGHFSATAWATGSPDGSRVELLPGARIVYLQSGAVTIPGSNVSTVGDTVVASAAVSAGQPVTTNRFAGPQALPLAIEPLIPCPGIDANTITWSTSAVLVGQWRIVTPDGTVTTMDTGQFLNVN
jgi:hypothetical protein